MIYKNELKDTAEDIYTKAYTKIKQILLQDAPHIRSGSMQERERERERERNRDQRHNIVSCMSLESRRF